MDPDRSEQRRFKRRASFLKEYNLSSVESMMN